MKPGMLACYKRCPIQYIGIFITFFVEVLAVTTFFILPLLSLFSMMYIIFAQMKLAADVIEKCADIVEAGKIPTEYVRKSTGQTLYYYTDYPFMGIMLLVIPSLIIGAFVMVALFIP